MDIVRKYRIPLFQAPDAPAPAAQGDAPPPAPLVADAPPADTPPLEPQDPPADPPAAPAEHGNKGKQPWFLQRISEETSKRTQIEAELAAERRARQDAEALAARLQADPAAPAAPRAPVQQIAEQDIDRLVDQRADQKRFFEDTSAVKNAGLQKFGASFENTLNILTAIGATTNDVVADILAVDKANAHVLLDKLGQDPERAAALVGMNSRTRIAELTRMSLMPNAPAAPVVEPTKAAPKQVSRAPAPPPPVEPSASKVTDWRTDDASDDEFDRGFRDMMQKRNARR